MFTKPKTFEELLALWETPTALSEDLNIPYVSAQMMRHRKSISPAHWPAFRAGAKRKGVKLTTDDMLRMKISRQRPQVPA